MDKMVIRKSRNGKILLLGCPATGLRGRIALGRTNCFFWHIAVRTQDFQHPGCIELMLDGRTYTEDTRIDTTKYSKCYIIKPGMPGTFTINLRWTSGHSPYPEIITMETWILGEYYQARDYPKAPDDYIQLAQVEVKANGLVLVNGRSAGFWPELLA